MIDSCHICPKQILEGCLWQAAVFHSWPHSKNLIVRYLPLARLKPAGLLLFVASKSNQKPLSPKWALSLGLEILLSRLAKNSRLHHDPAAPVLPLGTLLLARGSLIFILCRILYHIGKTMRQSSGQYYSVGLTIPCSLKTGPDVSGRPWFGDVILNE